MDVSEILAMVLLKMRANEIYRLYQLSTRVRKIANDEFWKNKLISDQLAFPESTISYRSWYLQVNKYPIAGEIKHPQLCRLTSIIQANGNYLLASNGVFYQATMFEGGGLRILDSGNSEIVKFDSHGIARLCWINKAGELYDADLIDEYHPRRLSNERFVQCAVALKIIAGVTINGELRIFYKGNLLEVEMEGVIRIFRSYL